MYTNNKRGQISIALICSVGPDHVIRMKNDKKLILWRTTKSNNINLIDFACLVEITSRYNIIGKYIPPTLKIFVSARLKDYLEKGRTPSDHKSKTQSIWLENLIK
jgi:hypothetical protein